MVNDTHNHDMLEDPFQLLEHQSRDPDKATIREYTQDLKAAALLYSKARRVIRTKGLRLTTKEYYNLAARGTKRTPSKEL